MRWPGSERLTTYKRLNTNSYLNTDLNHHTPNDTSQLEADRLHEDRAVGPPLLDAHGVALDEGVEEVHVLLDHMRERIVRWHQRVVAERDQHVWSLADQLDGPAVQHRLLRLRRQLGPLGRRRRVPQPPLQEAIRRAPEEVAAPVRRSVGVKAVAAQDRRVEAVDLSRQMGRERVMSTAADTLLICQSEV